LSNVKETLIREHFGELVQIHPGLTLCEDAPGRWVVRGLLSFESTFNETMIKDTFSILMKLPKNYPNSPPAVEETGGRIPPDFHQYRDRRLCLAAPVEVYRRFRAAPRLLPFVQTLLVQYLFGFAHLERFGKLPFGELSHGDQGVREYYQDAFNTEDVEGVLALLKIMADDTYRGHHVCPCGSGSILRKCHGPKLLSLLESQSKNRFLCDAESVLYSLGKDNLDNFNWRLLPKALRRKFDVMAREEAKG
jgi:hypothetical protein